MREGSIDPKTGFVVDFGKLSELVKAHVIEPLDHTHLGAGNARIVDSFGNNWCYWVPYFGVDFYPTSENLCRAIFKLLAPLVKELASDVSLSCITISETCTSEASWSRHDEYPNKI